MHSPGCSCTPPSLSKCLRKQGRMFAGVILSLELLLFIVTLCNVNEIHTENEINSIHLI